MHANDLIFGPQHELTKNLRPALTLDPAVLMQTQKSLTRYFLISPLGANQQVWAPCSPLKRTLSF